jgi:hypothetical protein
MSSPNKKPSRLELLQQIRDQKIKELDQADQIQQNLLREHRNLVVAVQGVMAQKQLAPESGPNCTLNLRKD